MVGPLEAQPTIVNRSFPHRRPVAPLPAIGWRPKKIVPMYDHVKKQPDFRRKADLRTEEQHKLVRFVFRTSP